MLLFIFTATSHAWDQCAALLALSLHGRSSAVTKQLPLYFNSLLLSVSLFSSPETLPGGRHFLFRVLRWYLLLTGNITGRRPAVLLFIFTATSHAWDQCAALLALSPWAFTNLDMNASARASTLLLEPSPDEHVNDDGNLATIGGQPATGYYFALGCGRQCLYVIL